MNRDSASASDGVERTVGSHFGIYARPLPGFINNVAALPDDTAATITWTTVSNATTQVQYGLSTNYNLSSMLLTNLVTNHAALLTNLTPGTSYYYAAYSKAGANLYVSSNFFFTTTNYVTSEILLDLTNTWDYTTNDLDGVNWTAADYDDSAWTGSGPGLLWIDLSGPNPDIPFLDTELPVDNGTGFPFITYYFRTHFSYTNSLSGVSLLFTNYVDDGAVFYLNGAEIYRLRMPDAPTPILNGTLATGYPCDGYSTCADPFTISGALTTNLVVGDNVLAVEVHLDNVQASAITFGSALMSTVPLPFSPFQSDHQSYLEPRWIHPARGRHLDRPVDECSRAGGEQPFHHDKFRVKRVLPPLEMSVFQGRLFLFPDCGQTACAPPVNRSHERIGPKTARPFPQRKTPVLIVHKVTEADQFVRVQEPQPFRNGLRRRGFGLIHASGLFSSDTLGPDHQQYDPADERERADDRRNEVAVGGLDVHAQEVNGLSRRCKTDARVSEHHDAQGDQYDGNYRFCVHVDSSVLLF